MLKKAQAGLDFLMTYGWALLLIVLVVGAMFSLGMFDIGSFTGSRASGFTAARPIAWNMDSSGQLTIQLRNNAGTDMNITNITATFRTATISNTDGAQILNGRASDTILVGSFASPPPEGASYTITMQITYTDVETGFAYADSGTLTGKVTT